MKVEGETAYCIDINTDFKNGYKTRADASSRMSADQISDVALSLEYVKQYSEAHKELNYKQGYPWRCGNSETRFRNGRYEATRKCHFERYCFWHHFLKWQFCFGWGQAIQEKWSGKDNSYRYWGYRFYFCRPFTLWKLVAIGITKTGSFNEIFLTAGSLFPTILLILSIMLPFILKFGGEKGRIAIIGVMGLIFVIGLLLIKTTEYLGIDLYVLINKLPKFEPLVYIILFLLFSVVILGISILISLTILKKKEF